MTKIAFDLGGVIIERGAMENFIVEDSIISVKMTVEKFGAENVFIISKAKEKYIERNIQLLTNTKFFQNTGLLLKNVYFVDEFKDKGVLGKKLGIDLILDDSIKVARFCYEAGFMVILFGQHEMAKKKEDWYMVAANWKNFRKLLERIKK